MTVFSASQCSAVPVVTVFSATVLVFSCCHCDSVFCLTVCSAVPVVTVFSATVLVFSCCHCDSVFCLTVCSAVPVVTVFSATQCWCSAVTVTMFSASQYVLLSLL